MAGNRDHSNIREQKGLRGPKGSSSDTDLRRESIDENLLERFDSTESLNDGELRRRTWSPAVLRKAVSVDGLNSSWRSVSEEDLRSRKSSQSIAVSIILFLSTYGIKKLLRRLNIFRFGGAGFGGEKSEV